VVLADVVLSAEDLEPLDEGRNDPSDLGQDVVGVGGFVIQRAAIFRRLRTDRVLQFPVAVALPKPKVLRRSSEKLFSS
jgi:hypothetical protein